MIESCDKKWQGWVTIYKIEDIAYIEFSQWKEKRGIDVAPILVIAYVRLFLDMFFLVELRDATTQELMNLRKDSMSVQE